VVVLSVIVFLLCEDLLLTRLVQAIQPLEADGPVGPAEPARHREFVPSSLDI
jgi:hypothetical protein